MIITDHPSPNFDERGGRAIDLVVLHYTGMANAEIALARLCDPSPRAGVYAFPWDRVDDPNAIVGRVSAHYVVMEDGQVLRLVDEDKRAWHAGLGAWAGGAELNARAIGIEIVNGGHDFGVPDYPPAQVAAVIELLRDICTRRKLRPHQIVGHSDVAPQRKADPGEKFPWGQLVEAGVALGASADLAPRGGASLERGDRGPEITALQKRLRDIGYALDADGIFGPITEAVTRAFQRRFRVEKIDGVADDQTRALIEDVARKTLSLSA
jgi:N-acetylmuramoyl-L-alanine amidase